MVGCTWPGGGIPAFWGPEWEPNETGAGGDHPSGEREEVTWSHSRSVAEQGTELGLC